MSPSILRTISSALSRNAPRNPSWSTSASTANAMPLLDRRKRRLSARILRHASGTSNFGEPPGAAGIAVFDPSTRGAHLPAAYQNSSTGSARRRTRSANNADSADMLQAMASTVNMRPAVISMGSSVARDQIIDNHRKRERRNVADGRHDRCKRHHDAAELSVSIAHGLEGGVLRELARDLSSIAFDFRITSPTTIATRAPKPKINPVEVRVTQWPVSC